MEIMQFVGFMALPGLCSGCIRVPEGVRRVQFPRAVQSGATRKKTSVFIKFRILCIPLISAHEASGAHLGVLRPRYGGY